MSGIETGDKPTIEQFRHFLERNLFEVVHHRTALKERVDNVKDRIAAMAKELDQLGLFPTEIFYSNTNPGKPVKALYIQRDDRPFGRGDLILYPDGRSAFHRSEGPYADSAILERRVKRYEAYSFENPSESELLTYAESMFNAMGNIVSAEADTALRAQIST